MKVLANDGISKSGIELLEKNSFEVELTKVAQEQLPKYINKNNGKYKQYRNHGKS